MYYNYTDSFINYLFSLKEKHFSENIITQVRKCLLDYLGVTMIGARMLQGKGDKVFCYLNGVHGTSTVIGFKQKTNIENSIFINGLCSHISELDDGSRFGAIHPGAPIISTLLPVAEKEKINPDKLFSSIIIGYEAAIRLAYAIQPSHYEMGYHPTATCGTIGAAIGLSILLDFSKEKMKDAFSAASISASGTLKVLDDMSELKSFNVGRASVLGYMSALMAQLDFKGPKDVLSGETGFLSMMSKETNRSLLNPVNDKQMYIEKIYFKPYASCRHTHPAIEATLKIRAHGNISLENIKKIKIFTYRSVIGKHDHTEIHGEYSAKMSIPYSVVVSLVSGKASIEEFVDNYIYDSTVRALLKKVEVYADDNISASVPKKRSAIVEIETNDNLFFSERVDYPKGEPENPLSNEELEDKFLSLAQFTGKSPIECEKIIRVIWNLQNNLDDLYQLL